MKKMVKQLVEEYDVYKQEKTKKVAYHRLLQPLTIPNGVRRDIIMGFVEELLKYKGKDTIMVIVDRFTKYIHFISLSHPFTAKMAAETFLSHFYKFHGLPIIIVTDRDNVFTSLF